MIRRMTREECVSRLKTKFKISELVCADVYNRFGEGAWRFLDDRILQVLYILRFEIFDAPITINNGKNYTQRGLRCNRCQLVRSKSTPYLSAHVLGKAFDMDVKGYTADEARQKIKANLAKFPFPIRMESGVSWLHIDVIDMGSGAKLTMFKG